MADKFKFSIQKDILEFKKSDLDLNYSVSGLRNKNYVLDFAIYRLGILSAIKSASENGSAIGIMITASHNPAEDNGIKIINSNGEMLDKKWINLANNLIKLENNQVFEWVLNKLKELDCEKNEKLVFLAIDTRDSSPRLINAASKGVRSINGNLKIFNLLTTPQLHFIVNSYNNKNNFNPDEKGYFEKITSSFKKLTNNLFTNKYDKVILNVDCANGVGANKLKILKDLLNEKILKMNLFNSGEGILNEKCGADFVKIEQKCPKNLTLVENERYVSIDGDADRLIYFYLDLKKNKFSIVDGDKISILYTIYLKKILSKLNILKEIDIAIIQTAYANGNSSRYIENELKMKIHCVATGVLNLHEKASEYDIGIYFEANGHGTILFSNKILNICKILYEKKKNSDAETFLNFINLINQTTGDAISNILTVEYILRYLEWTIDDWNNLYQDLPQKQVKIKLDNSVTIKLTKDERECLKPINFQLKLNEIVKKYSLCSRSFIRLSQTENLIRVYAESNCQENANNLAQEIADLVKMFFK